MFYGTNVQIINADVFRSLTNLTNCNSTFGGGSPRRFSYKDSENTTVDVNVNILNLWNNNPNLTTVSGCFANVYNVYCTGLNFHSSITSSKTIDISGLFGLSNGTYKNHSIIELDIDSIVPTLKTDNAYTISSAGNYYGTFQNRAVHINTSNATVMGKLSGACKNLFYGASIYVGDVVTKFNLSNVGNCTNMFRSCSVYKYSSDSSHTYGDSDRISSSRHTSCRTCRRCVLHRHPT